MKNKKGFFDIALHDNSMTKRHHSSNMSQMTITKHILFCNSTADACISWRKSGGFLEGLPRSTSLTMSFDRLSLYDFNDRLHTRTCAIIEAAALSSSGSLERRQVLLHAAAERFSPAACHELVSLWQNRQESYARSIADYWAEIAEWLPLEKPADASPCAAFYAAQSLENKERNPAAAYEAYLAVATTHPLAAACASRLGGAERRLDAWRLYRGPITRTVMSLQCHAIAMKLLSAFYRDESAQHF